MTNSNFMTAGTEIGGLLNTRKELDKKISNIICKACLSRVKTSSESNVNVERDIRNLIKDLPNEEQVDILLYMVNTILTQMKMSDVDDEDDDDSYFNKPNSIFSNRKRRY